MNVLVIVQHDGEWFEVKHVVDSPEKAEDCIRKERDRDRKRGIEYYYQTYEMEVQ